VLTIDFTTQAKPALRWKKAKMSGQRSETFNFSSPSSHISSASVLPPVESAGSGTLPPSRRQTNDTI
jgi:hypothetical protein